MLFALKHPDAFEQLKLGSHGRGPLVSRTLMYGLLRLSQWWTTFPDWVVSGEAVLAWLALRGVPAFYRLAFGYLYWIRGLAALESAARGGPAAPAAVRTGGGPAAMIPSGGSFHRHRPGWRRRARAAAPAGQSRSANVAPGPVSLRRAGPRAAIQGRRCGWDRAPDRQRHARAAGYHGRARVRAHAGRGAAVCVSCASELAARLLRWAAGGVPGPRARRGRDRASVQCVSARVDDGVATPHDSALRRPLHRRERGVAAEIARQLHVPPARIDRAQRHPDRGRRAAVPTRGPRLGSACGRDAGPARSAERTHVSAARGGGTAGCRVRCGRRGPGRAALEREARALGVAHRVAFVGFRHDTAALLAGADVSCCRR